MSKLTIGLAGSNQKSPLTAPGEPSGVEIDPATLPVYSVLVPVYKEPKVIPTLLRALTRLDYPPEKLDVLILLEEDDWETIEEAKLAKPPSFFRFIYVPKSQPQTKPTSIVNTGIIAYPAPRKRERQSARVGCGREARRGGNGCSNIPSNRLCRWMFTRR